MSISPPSDIVLDVLRASDPARQQAAAQKLIRSAAAGSSSSAQQIIRPTSAKPIRTSFDAEMSMTQLTSRANLAGSVRPSPSLAAGSVHQQFEAMVLKDFVQRMLPSKAESTFGQGTAGNVWKSWMADAVAKEIANSGTVGISKMLQPAPVAPTVKPAAQPDTVSRVMPIAKLQVVPEQVGMALGLRGFVAKLQEIFLNVFGSSKHAEAGNGHRLKSRPAFDV